MSTALALVADEVPAHVKNSQGLGNEGIGSNVIIPRIKLLQKMSHEVDKYNSKYVEGAEPGHFMNSLTQHNYGDEMYVLNVRFKEEFQVWRNYDDGGGFIGVFNTLEEAKDAVSQQPEEDEKFSIDQTHSHLLLMKDPETGELESTPALMDFKTSKLATSRKWNSVIVVQGGDRFSGLWRMKSKMMTSKNKVQYFNIDVEWVGWATDGDYEFAKDVYSRHAN